MAVTHHKSSTTIRGITYNYGDPFTCYAAYGGAETSEGSGSAADLTKGTTYYYAGYATGDTNNVTYPYAVSITSKGAVRGWYKENVFPYATYKVSYNANGGNGAPNSQTKTHGTALTLSSTKPTRTGYTFKCWNTKSDGSGTNYNASASYTANSATTLYAVWEEHYLTINYYSNYADSGTFEGIALSVSASTNVKVLSHKYYYDNAYSDGLYNIQNSEKLYLTRTGYTSTLNWGTSTSGGTLIDQYTSFTTGQALAKALGKDISSGNASINIYAQWRPNVLTIKYHANGGSTFSTEYYVNSNSNLISIQSSSSVLEDKWNYNSGHENGLYNASTFGLTREGYEFVGWKVGSSGKTVFDQNDATVVPTKLASNVTTGDRSITLYAVWAISGVVRIDNGDSFEPYLIYIDNGSSWDLYMAYIDDGENWIAIS